ncbi:hypothetical protein [Bosea sp. TND4EK4]|uniref:hypothetical protein n=1 Tax=Bosea sp. TND4EK4 TaxID=1907408 RepID=UPI0009556BC0|nr:hypothetical protein [Bosea sp. TND4EK4]SIR41399.1 hypothetical protein SAMN05880592_1208 [Bosea sp. TND4EK4]
MSLPKVTPFVARNFRLMGDGTKLAPNVGLVLALIAAGLVYNLVLLPNAPSGYPALTMNHEIYASITKALADGWYRLLLPFEYEVGRFYWCPSVIFLVYWAERLFGGAGSFAIFFSLFVTSVYFCSFNITKSRYFAGIVTFLFSFGTQLDYLFTFGNLIALYLVLTYVVINFYFLIRYLSTADDDWRALAFFAVSMVLVALSNEMWLNYATGLFCALVFGIFWSRRHRVHDLSRRCKFAAATLLMVLIAYLTIRIRVASQYVQPGAEEELIITYHHLSLFIDDVITNFFTLLYMSLSNYLPSFLSGSNSLVSLQPADIVASQHGYHAQYENLIVMNHLYMWRFHAGVLVALFFVALIWMLRRSWQTKDIAPAVVVALALMVVGGFSTHLSIKMRPYNSTPNLPYKVIMSVSAWTALIGYMAWQIAELKTERARRWIAIGVCVVALSAAITRPGMHAAFLAQTGLAGFADPMPKLKRLLHLSGT